MRITRSGLTCSLAVLAVVGLTVAPKLKEQPPEEQGLEVEVAEPVTDLELSFDSYVSDQWYRRPFPRLEDASGLTDLAVFVASDEVPPSLEEAPAQYTKVTWEESVSLVPPPAHQVIDLGDCAWDDVKTNCGCSVAGIYVYDPEGIYLMQIEAGRQTDWPWVPSWLPLGTRFPVQPQTR